MTSESYGMSAQELIQRLINPDRAKKLDPFMVLTLSDINLHSTVADIGCGPGFFTLPLGKYLVNGKLFALDIDDEMLEACRERVAEARLGNVEVLKCDEFEFPLDSGSLDGVFMAFVIQQSPDKPRLMRAVRELLRPNGWCTVLEWYKKETETGPPVERRVDPPELQIIAEEAGFRYVRSRDMNGEQYMVILRNV
jgi:ubiquinone/menaquinone biosynthesis C-methylase UbiE